MRMEKSYRVENGKVYMKMTHFDNDDVQKSVKEICLGARDAELARAQEDVTKGTTERDGISGAQAYAAPAATGRQGRERRWYTQNGRMYEEEIRRVRDGSIHRTSAKELGFPARALEHAEERLAELTEHRDGVQNAQ